MNMPTGYTKTQEQHKKTSLNMKLQDIKTTKLGHVLTLFFHSSLVILIYLINWTHHSTKSNGKNTLMPLSQFGKYLNGSDLKH